MVVDGQGGGLGKAVIEKINKAGLSVRVIAIGTNSAATMAMLRAGADDAATGENAIIVNARDADCIIGANGIVAANSMFGEITCAAACAVASSGGLKLLIPVNKCNLFLVGVKENGLGEKIDEAIEKMKLELSL
ncbi:MAG: DUF3842 family protein [Defluviitaleaceae bacterium]|nr:DUF3842 family protein [Defluviitaleaceae bacterium]